jgi:chromosome segregation and condensation protein ScpB
MRDLKLKDRKVIDQLEKQHIIEENPHPDNEDKAYFLALGGQFFMEELFDEDPELFKELQHNRFEF